METAVVFYTHDGSTGVAARIIGERIGADVFELEEMKKRGRSIFSFVAAGFAASIRKKSKIKDSYKLQMDGYERIYIGTPIWAGKATPAVNRFISDFEAGGKEVVIFTVQADKMPYGPGKKSGFDLKTMLEKKGAKILKVICLCGAPPGMKAETEDIRKQIEKHL